MAVGKNKRISKGKIGGKKKVVDPFAKRDWYDIKAPSMFTVRNAGKTQETKIASEGINLKVFQVCHLGDRFTQRRKNQVKRNTYAQSCQIRKMVESMVNKDSSSDFKESVAKLIPELFGKEIEKVTSGNYPLQNAFIGKAKTLKAAKSDRGKLINGGSRSLCRR